MTKRVMLTLMILSTFLSFIWDIALKHQKNGLIKLMLLIKKQAFKHLPVYQHRLTNLLIVEDCVSIQECVAGRYKTHFPDNKTWLPVFL